MFVGSILPSPTGLEPYVKDAIHRQPFFYPVLRWDLEPVQSPALFLILLAVTSEMFIISTVVALAGLCSPIFLRSSSAISSIAIGTNLGGEFVDGDVEVAKFFVLLDFPSDLGYSKVLSFDTTIYFLEERSQSMPK